LNEALPSHLEQALASETLKFNWSHMDSKELPYTFISVDRMLEDFIAAVETRRAS
jgi:hypothetical protein